MRVCVWRQGDRKWETWGQGRFGDGLVYGERSLEVQDGLFSCLYFKAL